MHTIKGAWSMPTIALATCNDSRGRKTRIRRSKEERKSMVETFIKTYQKSNNGNFPSLSVTQQEVGGSFYTVREIVREIIQENRVLGPAKLHSGEQTDQISLEQHPLGSISTESHTSLSSTGEIHVITDATTPNPYQGTSENNVLDSNNHFHRADNSLDNGISKVNEGCKEPATTNVTHSCNENIQEQLLHSNGELSYGKKVLNEETVGYAETFDKDENSSKSGLVVHQEDATINQVHYLGVNITEKDQAYGEPVYTESLIRETRDENADGIEKLEASKVGITQKTEDGKLSETGDVSHRTRIEEDSRNFSENCSGLMSEQVDATLLGPSLEGNTNIDMVKKETLLESGESSLQISTPSSNEIASATDFKPDDSSAIIKASNGSSHTTLVAEESLEINNTPSVQQNSVHQKGRNPPISRTNLETRKRATETPSNKSETNPLLALFKACLTAFVKFWTEE